MAVARAPALHAAAPAHSLRISHPFFTSSCLAFRATTSSSLSCSNSTSHDALQWRPQQTRSEVFQICRAEPDDLLSKLERDSNLIEQFLPDFAELEKDALSSVLELELESSFSLDLPRHFEIMFLVHEENVNEVQDVVKKIRDFIEDNKGKVWRLNDWGMRRLAYKIKKANRANYILMNIELGSQVINQLKSLLDNDERVIRHLVTSQKEAITEDLEPPPEYSPYGSEVKGEDTEELQDTDSEEELEDTEELQDTEEEEVALQV